jgi:hypothetical protein
LSIQTTCFLTSLSIHFFGDSELIIFLIESCS